MLAVSAALAIAAAAIASLISTDAGPSTLVDTDTASYRATQELHAEFGEDPVVVLAKGDLQQLLLTPNLGRLLRLEGCLSGKVPPGVRPTPGPCAELARTRPVKFVSGPATFLNEAVIQIGRQLARMAARVPPRQLREFLLEVAARYGITSAPSLNNPEFVAAVVFDLRRSRGTPKARLAYLFPNKHSAQIVVRLRPDLSESERHQALETIREAVEESKLHGGDYVVSGVPVVVDGVSRALKDALLLLLAVSVVVMALVLLAVFRSRLRLLPLALALGAAALDFGLFELAGGSLTMASIAVLPILIGLAVDYAIQFQARYDEVVAAGLHGVDAARRATALSGPTIATACLATAAGFLALQLSPTPMVRSFGLLLVLGIAIAFGLAVTVGFAALSLRPGVGGSGADARGVPFFAPQLLRDRLRGWRKTQRAEGHPNLPPHLPPLLSRILDLALAHPRRILGIGLALAVLGWGLGTQIETDSDIRDLAPQSIRAVRDLNRVQEATGVSGELDVRVHAPDLTDPATLRWMAAFKRRVLSSNGFSGPNPSCLEAEVCPGRRCRISWSAAVGRCDGQTSAPRCASCPPTTSSRSPPPTRARGFRATPRCSASASAPSRWKPSRT